MGVIWRHLLVTELLWDLSSAGISEQDWDGLWPNLRLMRLAGCHVDLNQKE